MYRINEDGMFESDHLRTLRNTLLEQSDFTQLEDFPGDKAAWAEYRQQLRDLPQQYDNVEDVVLPVDPTGVETPNPFKKVD